MTIYGAVRVIDCETLGLAADSKVCEIGWCDVYALSRDEKGEPAQWAVEKTPHSLLINPGVPIPPEAQAVHHISDEDVADAPDFIDAILSVTSPHTLHPECAKINAWAAHNAKFDRQFLGEHLKGEWICTMRCWQHVEPGAPGFSNQVLRYHLKPRGLNPKKAQPSHRAAPDSYVSAFLLRDLLNRGNSVERLVRATERTPLLKICPIGDDWRGKPFETLDTKSLRWLATRPDSEEIKHTAAHWLRERGESL